MFKGRRMAATAVLSSAMLGWMLANAMAGGVTSEVRGEAMATVALYGTHKTAALNCLTHEPAVGMDMRQVFSRGRGVLSSPEVGCTTPFPPRRICGQQIL
jgi:hypothetical protein